MLYEVITFLPRDEVLLLCTGSQGEPRSALWRIANDEHPNIDLEAGDAVIFSSRIIPGNDIAIFNLQNRLARRGIEVITDDDHFVHVSGHPAREELTQMYQWVRPRVAVPVHGEARHLFEHVITSYSIHYTKLYEFECGQSGSAGDPLW